MGVCLSCLGLRQQQVSDAERQRLLYDDPYGNVHGGNYGSWSQAPPVPSESHMSPDEMRREQRALDSITRWASDQIVEIFPHRTALANVNMGGGGGASNHINGHVNGHANGGTEVGSIHEGGNANGVNGAGILAATHHDILLNMIPGDKSKRSIRIYAASRPGSSLSQNTDSIKSKVSATRLSGHHHASAGESKAKGVFVKLNVELP